MSSRIHNKKGKFQSAAMAGCLKKRKLFGLKIHHEDNASVSDVTMSESISPHSPPETILCDKESVGIRWNTGRRIVELGHLAKQMICTDCKEVLDLNRTESETRRGFGSILYIMCSCGVLNSVTTSKSHQIKKKGVPVFDINTKAVMGK